jgi:AraC-like DNA-binding protein
MNYSTIYFIGAAQGFILAIALWRRKANNRSNHVLAIWLILMAIDLSLKALYLNGIRHFVLRPFILVQLFPFLYGSLFYLYVRTLVTKTPIKLKDIIHFAAFLFFTLINIPYIIDPFNKTVVDFKHFDLILDIYSISYVVAGLLLIRHYRKNLIQQQVDTQNVDLLWLKIMGYSQVVIWLIAVAQWILPFPKFNSWVIYVVISLWMILIGYLSLLQQNVPVLKPIKSSNTQEDDSRFNEVKTKLNQLIHDEKIHLQPSLTIGQLAKKSGYPEYLISLFVNRVHNMSFRDYINDLRISEAKAMLLDNKNKRTILDIAYECGFNSKSTFNSAFKKITHQTPSQFKQKQVEF